MSNYNKLMTNLETLKLVKFRENLDSYLDMINDSKKDVVESLYELTNYEIELLHERQVKNSLQFAGFPFQKTFEDFDFSFQPSINREKILEFKNLRFVERKENILFLGNSGVGKTHLSVAIGVEAAKNRVSTYFINCNDLIGNLKVAQAETRLTMRLNQYARYKVLIIDEIGFLPIDLEGAHCLFQLINKRYEKNSTIITTNMPFSKWGVVW